MTHHPATSYHDAAMREDKARTAPVYEAADSWARAFAWEEMAANSLKHERTAEPYRSVLYRSAATLALESGFATARKLIMEGLGGDLPQEIAIELRSLKAAVEKMAVTLKTLE